MFNTLSPFDFSKFTVAHVRKSFSSEWRKYYASRLQKFKLIYFIAPGGADHMVFSHELVLTHVGKDYDSAIKSFVIALNGYYSHFLLEMKDPYNVHKIDNGLVKLKNDMLSKGWVFTDGEAIAPGLDYYLKVEPRFKQNILDVVSVKQFEFECEIPLVL